jgi:hypothetical protein
MAEANASFAICRRIFIKSTVWAIPDFRSLTRPSEREASTAVKVAMVTTE